MKTAILQIGGGNPKSDVNYPLNVAEKLERRKKFQRLILEKREERAAITKNKADEIQGF